MKLPNILKPKNNYQLMRLGKNNDGGYLIGKKSVTNSKNLISFGIADDWTFEDHFQKINKDIKVKTYPKSLNDINLLIMMMFYRYHLIKVIFFLK